MNSFASADNTDDDAALKSTTRVQINVSCFTRPTLSQGCLFSKFSNTKTIMLHESGDINKYSTHYTDQWLKSGYGHG